MAKKINPASLANLRPIKEGEVKNKFGRKGKSGTGGLSLKGEFRDYIQNATKEQRDAVWVGLWNKAMSGDVAAIKLWVELNGERVVDDVHVDTGSNGPKIIIQMPAMEDTSN